MDSEKNLTPTQQQVLESLLENVKKDQDFVNVDVPSKCQWYETDKISVRPFTFKDEKVALSPSNQAKDFLNILLKRCVQGIDPQDLFLIDRNAIILKIKEMSTGSDVTVQITCSKCGKTSEITVDLNILPIVPVDVELPLEIHLDGINKTAKILPPKVKDEDYLLGLNLISTNLWRFVTEIEGVTDEMVITEVIDNLPVMDMHKLLRALNFAEYGVQTTINYECGCGNVQEVEVPVTENFFGQI